MRSPFQIRWRFLHEPRTREPELRVVEKIEELGTELESHPFTEGGLLKERKVKVASSITAE